MRRPQKNQSEIRKLRKNLKVLYSEYTKLNKSKEDINILNQLIDIIPSTEYKYVIKLQERRLNSKNG